jgi:hypothetical protein
VRRADIHPQGAAPPAAENFAVRRLGSGPFNDTVTIARELALFLAERRRPELGDVPCGTRLVQLDRILKHHECRRWCTTARSRNRRSTMAVGGGRPLSASKLSSTNTGRSFSRVSRALPQSPCQVGPDRARPAADNFAYCCAQPANIAVTTRCACIGSFRSATQAVHVGVVRSIPPPDSPGPMTIGGRVPLSQP